MRPVPRPKNQWDSFRYAIEGIVHVFRTQKHMRAHFLIVAFVLLLGMFCRFTAVAMVELLLVMSYHPLAKLAKDIAAGAVLMTAIVAAVVGAVLFIGSIKLFPLKTIIMRDRNPIELWVPITLVVLLLVVVMIAKIMGGKGSILSGGVVSGHAAVAFIIAGTISYRVGHDPVVTILALVLAFLVGQARVEGKVHTLKEVFIGGLLGICFTTGVYYFRIGHP